MKKRLFALVLALAMTVALCACGGDKPSDQTVDPTNTGSTGEKLTGGTLTVGIAADLDTSLDPHVSSSSAGTREVLFNIYEGLMKPDTEGNLIPAVAESCTVNETADVYTYTLREGVKFHNGADVTVGDVVYSLTRAAGLETGEPLVGEVKGIASVEATDDRTVVVTLKAPDAEFNAYMSVAIIPQGIDPNDSPVGTGPFRFVSHTAQDSVVLEKFDEYWGQGAYLDKVILKVIPDPQTLVMSLRSGAIDLACHLDATQIANMADMTVMEGSSNVIQALYLNHDFAPFADERVRQALCYAVDKQAVIDLAMDGHGTPVGTSMLSTLGRYAMPELADYYKPDVEKAKALLKEAGYENLSFTITVPSNYASHVGTAQVLVEQLKAVGVDAKIDLVDWNTWLTETYQGRNFEATVSGFDSHSLSATGCLARFQSESGKNFINFRNADYDAAYAAAVSSLNADEQTALFKQCETILAETAANVYLQDMSTFAVMQPGVGGFVYYPALYIMDLATLYRIG